MKLELKHLAPYLPYRLKVEMLDYKIDYVNKRYDEITGFHKWDNNSLSCYVLTVGCSKPNIDRVKPILRPLSDITKEIEHNGEIFVPRSRIYGNPLDYKIKMVSFGVVQKLLEYHFDVFGLIDAGLAIDINTLNK